MFESISLPALVCVLLNLNPQIKKEKETAYYFLKYTQNYEVPLELAVSIAYAESGLKHWKTPNATNDYGIMQVHKPIWEPHCKKYLRRKCDLRNLRDNIMMGVFILNIGYSRGEPIRFYAGKKKKKNYLKYKRKVSRIKNKKVIPAFKKCMTAEYDY